LRHLHSFPTRRSSDLNDWNTMATPFGGPLMTSPRHSALPEDGAISPAMMRSSVDLPDPERPSRPTISPDWMVRSTFSSTSRSSRSEEHTSELQSLTNL